MDAIIGFALLVVAFIILLAGITILIARRRAARVHQRLVRALDAAVGRLGLNLDQQEFLLRRFIGIDYSQRILLFIDSGGPEEVIELIDLERIAHCAVVRCGTEGSESRNGIRIIDEMSVQLGLSLLLKNNHECYLRFYDQSTDGIDERADLDGKAVKWCGILNRETQHNPSLKRI